MTQNSHIDEPVQSRKQICICKVKIKGSVQSRNVIDINSRLDITEFAGAFSGAFEAPAKRAPLIPHP